MKRRFYLAYGSNLNKAQMHLRCPDAKVAGTGYLEGYELLFKGSGTGSYLTVERREGARVPVAAWLVSEADEANLDRYEGFPSFYYKRELVLPICSATTGVEALRRAFVYIMHEERLPGLPSTAYWRTCMQGYQDFGFDPDYLHRAVEVTSRSRQRRAGARSVVCGKKGVRA